MDDISARLREGCPSYYKESDYKFYLAVECLERAVATNDTEERENLAREAFKYLSKVPESADLRTVCKRFEDLRSVIPEYLFSASFLIGQGFVLLLNPFLPLLPPSNQSGLLHLMT